MVWKLACRISVLALVCVLPGAAWAGPWTVSAGGGATIPTGDFADEAVLDAKAGFQFGGAVDYRIHPLIALGIDGNWDRNTHAQEGTTLVSDGGFTMDRFDKDKTTIWQISAHGSFFPPVSGPIAPYVTLGAGIYSAKRSTEYLHTVGASSTSESVDSKASSRLGFKGGIGGVYALSDALGISLQGDYTLVTLESSARANSLQYIGVTLAFVFDLQQ